ALDHAFRRWATGSYLVWYPVKDRDAANAFLAEMRALRAPKTLRAELRVAPETAPGLAACGLLAVNPPHTMAAALGAILPCLAGLLGQDGAGAFSLDWLVAEAKAPPASR
ncbi:MAG: 23S rRNA (adenine(2030)-N(6))-methyltransferase RlmJ, partial [Alphaproteobacteria bacterium]|nr:23S rRNA (adenine(2030)-N(6))-methyltransferase RlmJ [Alphaproteobacteria bacterium]